MTNSSDNTKKRLLEERKANLLEEYEAANKQLDREVSAANRKRIEREIDTLGDELEKVELELERFTTGLRKPYEPPRFHGIGLRTGLVIMLMLLGVGWLIWLQFIPDCRPPLIQFHVFAQGQAGVIVIPDSRFDVGLGESLMVRAIINDEEPNGRSRYSCELAYTGDGRIIATVGCSLQLRAGHDLINDIVTLTVNQQGCSTRHVETFFLGPTN